MAEGLGMRPSIMNIAVSITALFSGIFIVVMGGLADRLGRVRVLKWLYLRNYRRNSWCCIGQYQKRNPGGL